MTTRLPSPQVGILRYNAGNARSVEHAVERLGIGTISVETPEDLDRINGLIFPGAGAAGTAMADLRARNFIEPLQKFRKPFLGLCLGMQLLFDFSEEGNTNCLGIVKGNVRELSSEIIKPHMGWNRLDTGEYAYFCHSFTCVPDDPAIWKQITLYGKALCAGVQQGNYQGVQWHPEKSGPAGDQLFRSFAEQCN